MKRLLLALLLSLSVSAAYAASTQVTIIGATGGAATVTGGALNVNATITPSGTQDVNITKYGGTATTLGQKAMAASLPVTISSDQSAVPVSISGNQAINLVQVAGASVATGHGTASGAIRVELPTDGTGVVGLNAGTNLVGKVGIDQTTPGTTNAVTTTPSSATAVSISPVVTSAAASSKVLKASAGNLYGFSCTSGASAGVCYVFDATSLPGNGAVTPVDCIIVAATQTAEVTYNPPLTMATGATIGFGTGTNCFSLTASSTAFISGEAK